MFFRSIEANRILESDENACDDQSLQSGPSEEPAILESSSMNAQSAMPMKHAAS